MTTNSPGTKITIPYTWGQLVELWCYLLELDAHGRLPDALRDLFKTVDAKVHAHVRRGLYTAYKTAQTSEEREQARQAYLDEVGIPTSYRWPEGYDPYTHD